MKRKGCAWLAVGVVVTATVAHVLLSYLPNRDDAAVEVLRGAGGGEVRRTCRLLPLSALLDAEIYPRGDVWSVYLRDAEISNEVAERLSGLRSLYALDIYRCRVPAGMTTALIPPSDQMRRVYISDANVGDHQISTLRDCPNLQSLTLKGTDVSDASVPTIVMCRKLGSIVLRGNKFTESGIATLRAAFPSANVVTE
jgi:hypothetical protein